VVVPKYMLCIIFIYPVRGAQGPGEKQTPVADFTMVAKQYKKSAKSQLAQRPRGSPGGGTP
jgi:hypothetical protein